MRCKIIGLKGSTFTVYKRVTLLNEDILYLHDATFMNKAAKTAYTVRAVCRLMPSTHCYVIFHQATQNLGHGYAVNRPSYNRYVFRFVFFSDMSGF